MARNGKLKAALYERNVTLRELSQRTGINRSYLSWATTGRLVLRPDEQSSIASALILPVSALF